MSRRFWDLLPFVGAMWVVGCGGPTDVPADGGVEATPACPLLAAGTDVQTLKAYDRTNMYRLSAGVSCINFVPAIATAAAAHCAYFVANHGNCVSSPHREVSTCDGFVAERFGDRLKRAGYTGNAAYEDMAYLGKGADAVDQWVNTIWHRIPILSPYVGDAGYGKADRCDTMDFGWAQNAPGVVLPPVVYPYDHQTGVPTSFDGDTEYPAPPRPPKGWPSGYPIIIYASRLVVRTHQLFDDKGAEVDHTFIAPGDHDSNDILLNEVVMYAHRPLKQQTTYRVVIDGLRQDTPLRLEWTFTTAGG